MRVMADVTREADWSLIEAHLPEGWRELATEMGLVRKRPPHMGQKITDIAVALRLVLHYAAQRGSMRLTTSAAASAGIVAISQPGFFKWIFKIGAYLEALVARMVDPSRFGSERWGGYSLIVADATTVERPGAKGTTSRIHYALQLADLQPRTIRVTDEKVGETMRNYDPEPGELWIVDRAYSTPPSVLYVVERGSDILVRVNRHSLPLRDARGRRIDIPSLLASTPRRGRARGKSVRVVTADGREARARLSWVWLPSANAVKARANATRDGVKEAVELHLTEYLAVLTTASRSRLTDAQALELYRARWQVELDFKRDKSIGQLDTLPNLLSKTIHSWLYAKVLLTLIGKRIATQNVAIPPCGLADAILPVVEKDDRMAAGPRRRTLERHAIGVADHASCSRAHHAA